MTKRDPGLPPVNAVQEHAQDARATIKKRHGAYLPHWTRDAAWYSVTFRLWDSLPQHVIESWLFERKNIRFDDATVIPVWFSDVDESMFDTTRSKGGLSFDRSKNFDDQITELAELLLKKLAETR